jgi:phage-related protein
MVRFPPVPTEKPLRWIGSAKRDYAAFPEMVRNNMGFAFSWAQYGRTYPTAKTWKGEGPGVFELVQSHEGNAYRAVYTVRFEEAVYVLHAFQKKSPSGIRTDRRDIQLIAKRLREARKHYEAQRNEM